VGEAVAVEEAEEAAGDALLINCEICKEPTAKSKTEVDHKVEAGTLKTAQDVLQFIYRLLFISWEDLRVLCKECHAIVTYAARFNIPFQEAKIEKQVVAFCKQPAKQQIAELISYGFSQTTPLLRNSEKRKECYRRHLKET
jgi:RNase P subunit RPR2